MPVLTAKARQFIEWGVDEIADHEQRKAWFSWAQANPDIRMPGETWQAAAGKLPLDVVAVAFFVLEHIARFKRKELERAGLSEDEIADIDNDLGYIQSVKKFLYEGMLETKRLAELAEKARRALESGDTAGALAILQQAA